MAAFPAGLKCTRMYFGVYFNFARNCSMKEERWLIGLGI